MFTSHHQKSHNSKTRTSTDLDTEVAAENRALRAHRDVTVRRVVHHNGEVWLDTLLCTRTSIPIPQLQRFTTLVGEQPEATWVAIAVNKLHCLDL